MLSIVVINTITIFVGGYWQGSRLFIWLDAVFTLLFFVGGILGLFLVNSIIVDAMASDNNDEVLKKLDELERKIEELSSKDLHK